MKLKRATWKLRTEALRRYRQKHKGSLDRAEEEVDKMLKSKIAWASKTPMDTYVSADKRVDNTDVPKLQSTGKHDTKQLNIDKIKEIPLSSTVEVPDRKGDDKSYRHQWSVTGSRECVTGTPTTMSGNKELINSQKPTHENDKCNAVTAVAVVGYDAGGENFDKESVYDENASVFDDELIFGDVCLTYDTSSMSVEIFTDRAISEKSFTEDKPQEDASQYHNDSRAAENGELSLKLPVDEDGVSTNSNDETFSSVNVAQHVAKPIGEKLLPEKQYNVRESQRLKSKKDALKSKIYIPEERVDDNRRSKLVSDSNTNVDGFGYDEQLPEAAENAAKLTQLQLDGRLTEAVRTGSMAMDNTLQQQQMREQSLTGSRQISSQCGTVSSHDNSDAITQQAHKKHISETMKHPDKLSSLELEKMAATETGSMAGESGLRQVSDHSSSTSRHISRQDYSDSGSILDNELMPETADERQNHPARQTDSTETDNVGCASADESPKQHQVREASLSPSSQHVSQIGVISRHDSVPLARRLSSRSSHTSDLNWHFTSVVESTFDDTEAVLSASKSRIQSTSCEGSNVKSDLLHKSAASDTGNEGKSVSDLGSVRSHTSSASGSGSHRRLVAADGDKDRKSDTVPSPVQHLSSSDDGSDWHLASMFREDSGRHSQHSGGASTQSNSALNPSSAKSIGSSVCSSEWHMRSLLFENSYLSRRQLSGDLHATAVSC